MEITMPLNIVEKSLHKPRFSFKISCMNVLPGYRHFECLFRDFSVPGRGGLVFYAGWLNLF